MDAVETGSALDRIDRSLAAVARLAVAEWAPEDAVSLRGTVPLQDGSCVRIIIGVTEVVPMAAVHPPEPTGWRKWLGLGPAKPRSWTVTW